MVGRRRRPHGPDDVEVVVAVEARVDAALEADLGGAPLLGFHHPLGDVVEIEEVGVAAQVQ